MIEIILFFPPLAAVVMMLVRSKKFNIVIMISYALVLAFVSFKICVEGAAFGAFFGVDGLAPLFLLVLAFVFGGGAFYSIEYLSDDKINRWRHSLYSCALVMFACFMAGAILSKNLGLMWVFIEATTLASAYLIYFKGERSSLEAAWKYIFICSIGIALAFTGIVFLSMGTGAMNSLFFDDLNSGAAGINKFWLKLAFVFMLVGFGTKAGLAPMHAWLPDAHSEAPSPVSSMLSGALLNCALLAILRVYKIAALAGLESTIKPLMMFMGLLSIFVSAVFILRVKNYKRMLAYSSVENMGIILIGAATGGAGFFGAMLHTFSHSLSKAILFLTSGNILKIFGKKEIDNISGVLQADKFTGWLWIAGFIFIAGIPPAPAFLSEFIIIKEMLSDGKYMQVVIFLILLTVILFGMGAAVFKMSFGENSAPPAHKKPGIFAYLPQIIMLAVLLLTGLFMPEFISAVIRKAAMYLG